MQPFSSELFYPAALSAGAILSGFCGTFLTFRIQREANYYRQVAVDFTAVAGVDVLLDLSHFSSSFLVLLMASICAGFFGLVLPLLFMGGIWAVSVRGIIGGMLAAILLLSAYFADELI